MCVGSKWITKGQDYMNYSFIPSVPTGVCFCSKAKWFRFLCNLKASTVINGNSSVKRKQTNVQFGLIKCSVCEQRTKRLLVNRSSLFRVHSCES